MDGGQRGGKNLVGVPATVFQTTTATRFFFALIWLSIIPLPWDFSPRSLAFAIPRFWMDEVVVTRDSWSRGDRSCSPL